MVLPFSFHNYFSYFFQRDVTKLYIAVAIRNFALGMVLIFEAIYLYEYFKQSIPFTLLYFASVYGIYAAAAVLGGKIMAHIGTSKSILISSFFYSAYYVSLFFLGEYPLILPLSVLLSVIGMLLFWPAFQVDFARFSTKEARGKEVGRLNVATFLPTIISPLLGGWILSQFGYQVLFLIVFILFLVSTIPLFYAKDTKEFYSDSFKGIWRKIFAKKNKGVTVAFMADGLELTVYFIVWPLFLFLLGMSFSSLGGITAAALIASSLFMLYVGRISNSMEERSWLLNIGSLWTSIAWVLQYFIVTLFDAFLAHIIYRISRSAAGVPFQTIFYENASSRNDDADEFIIHREVLIGVSRCLFLGGAALLFILIPHLSISILFFAAAIFSLGFMFAGKLPKFQF